MIDQLLAGWYGGFAVEAMALGKPVINYIREEDLQFIPEEMKKDLPFIQATTESVATVLREWLTYRVAELPLKGKQSRAFVEKWHNPLQIAGMVTEAYSKK